MYDNVLLSFMHKNWQPDLAQWHFRSDNLHSNTQNDADYTIAQDYYDNHKSKQQKDRFHKNIGSNTLMKPTEQIMSCGSYRVTSI